MMDGQRQGPWQNYAAPQAPPHGPWDQYAPQSNGADPTAQQAQDAANALVHGNLLNVPPSYAYEHRDTIKQLLGDRLGGYAEAADYGFRKESIAGLSVGLWMNKQLPSPFEDTDEIGRFLEGLGSMVADIPAYLAGGVLGAWAGGAAGSFEVPGIGTISGAAVGGGAGAFALPAGIRAWLMDKYSQRKVSSFEEVMDVLKASGKGAVVGGLTSFAGEAVGVSRLFGPRPYTLATSRVAMATKAATELAALTTVGDLTEGKIPSAADFAQNAALLGVMHVAMGSLEFAKNSLPEIQRKSMDLYAREGVHPAEISSAAAQRAVEEAPAENPMEVLNKIDNEIAALAQKPPEAAETEQETPKSKATVAPEPTGERETSIKNVVTEAERAERGLSEIEIEARQVPAFEAGKKAVDENRIDPRKLAEELAKKPRPHTDEESAALLYDRMRLQNEHAQVMSAIDDDRSTGNEAKEVVDRDRLQKIEDAMNTNDYAARRSGTETGRALNARRMMIKQDYSLANVLQRARAASPDGMVAPDVRDRLETLAKQLEEANRRIDEYEETKKQQAAERTVEKIKGQQARVERTGKRVAAKADLKTEYDSLIKELNAELQQLSANPMLNPKLYELFGKLAVNRIQSGLLTIEQIVDDLHGALQENGISKREIRDYISQYGKKIELSKDQIKVQLREARRQGRLISAIEDAQARERPLHSGLQRDAQTERVKELNKQLREAMKESGLTYEGDQQTIDARNLARYKTTLQNKIKTLQKQLDTGDFTKPTRRQTILDRQAEDLKAQAEKIKSQVDDAIYKQKMAARTPIEKGAAMFQKWRRAVLLSSVTTLGKLQTAAMLRFGTTPIEELVGGVLSRFPGISEISAKAPREGGGLQLSAEAKAFGQFFEKATAQDIREALRTGKTSLDYLYGKKSTLPPEALDFFGHVHGALKVLPKRAEFFRSLEKRAQWALDNHLDIQDPKVQATMAADAYIDANAAIFMQDNFINTGFRMLMNYFHSQGLSGRATEFMIHTVLPIVKVPTNIVAETGTYAFGSVTGSIEALSTLIKTDGLKNLTMHQADNIMRSLKKGSIGLAVLAMGYYAGKSSGFIQSTGFYQPEDEKKRVKPETLTIGGIEVPPWLQHTPVGLVFEMGATLRRVNDAYTMRGKSGGFVAGATSAGLGAVKKVPFIEEAARLAEATRTAESAGLFLDDLVQSLIIPPDVRRIAQMQDHGARRKPTNLKETLEENIPGLRENVPTKKTSRRFRIR
jgi:hypothetical protein